MSVWGCVALSTSSLSEVMNSSDRRRYCESYRGWLCECWIHVAMIAGIKPGNPSRKSHDLRIVEG